MSGDGSKTKGGWDVSCVRKEGVGDQEKDEEK